MKINNLKINLDNPPILIAEISGNHNQSLTKAIELLKKIKKTGVKFVKIQTYTPDTITLNSSRKEFIIDKNHKLWGGKKLYDLYKKAHTPWNWHNKIFEVARKLDLICFSSPFDETAVDFLESLDVPLYKVASFEITHIPLIKRIAKTKKPVIMSTGMATKGEIKTAVDTLRKYGCKNYSLLKCTSTYPANPKNSNILTIPDMKKIYKCEIGLSDHTPGIGAAVGAIALGATIIEKHITLDKKNGAVDSKFSLEPYEFKILNDEIYNTWKSLGKIKYGPTNDEKNSLKYRRSIYTVKDIKKGDKITKDNIRVVRPNLGLSPKYYDKVIRMQVNRNIKKNSPLLLKYLSNKIS